MDILPTLLRVHESGDPETAFRVMVDSLTPALPLHCAAWVGPDNGTSQYVSPADVEISSDLRRLATHAVRPEVFPMSLLLPALEERFPAAELLVLPLPRAEPPCGSVVLVSQAGRLGDDLEPWQRLGSALGRVALQHRLRHQKDEEIKALRHRAEEIEALHALGLAANRTLDPDEVLGLVARFTRTLLGAHYVTVNTAQDGEVRVVASVGLRNSEAAEPGDHYADFAQRVMEAEKPLAVGGAEADFGIEVFPFHLREGMRVGLGIPLSLYGQTFGALIVGYRREYTLTPRDTRLALTLAGHAAVAISNARLHHAVEEHSHQLEGAYEELNQLTRAKERFYNAISHDLRTPVGAIKGYMELLLEDMADELSPETCWVVENSQRAATTLLALVNDLLDFAKLEAGKVEMNIRTAMLEEIVEDALATVRPQAEAKGLQLVVPPLDDLPPLQTDPKRVCQILVNLLSNAVKFTPSGEIALRARYVEGDAFATPPGDGAAQSNGPAPQFEIQVADTGPGIAAENLDRIFQEFEQVAGSEGTGLGLPISRKLARLLGGELVVESEVGEGSTFVLRLPGSTQDDAGSVR